MDNDCLQMPSLLAGHAYKSLWFGFFKPLKDLEEKCMALHVLQEWPFLIGETFPGCSGSGGQEEKLPAPSFIDQHLPLSLP